MFGNHFYNKRVRTTVSIFGSLFNNIHVIRTNASNEVISQVKVPLSYAPKRNFLERLSAMADGEQAERRVAMKLPRMSFEITVMSYDPIRQLPKVNSYRETLPADNTKGRKVYTGVPYNIQFQLNIYAKSQDDALQIVEQIIPYFAPQYNLTVKPFADYPDVKEDVPVILQGVTFSDDFEGGFEQRRTIVYTLDFQMKINFYGPDRDRAIIREVNSPLNILALNENQFVETINITPDPIGISPDSDYGFNVKYLDSDGNEF